MHPGVNGQADADERVGGVAMVIGIVPTGFGMPWWLSLPTGAAALIAILFIFGKRVDEGVVMPQSDAI